MSLFSSRYSPIVPPPRPSRPFLPTLNFLKAGPSIPHLLITGLFLAAAQARFAGALTPKFNRWIEKQKKANRDVASLEVAESNPYGHQRVVGTLDAAVAVAMLTVDGPHLKGIVDGLKVRRGAEVIGAALVSAGIYARVKSGLRIGKQWVILAMLMWASAMDWAILGRLQPMVAQAIGVEHGMKQLLHYLAYVP